MITVVTLTKNRPEAFNLLREWVVRQTYKGDMQWLVVTDGKLDGYDFDSPLIDLAVRKPKKGEFHSHISNIHYAVPRVKGDPVLFMEDDDWYAPNYIEDRLSSMEGVLVSGVTPPLYYHVGLRRAKKLSKNKVFAPLSTTTMRAEVLPLLDEVAHKREARKRLMVDSRFWTRRLVEDDVPRRITHQSPPDDVIFVGMKGMPGQPGIGIGHRKRSPGNDPEMETLRKWIGEDAERYAKYYTGPKK